MKCDKNVIFTFDFGQFILGERLELHIVNIQTWVHDVSQGAPHFHEEKTARLVVAAQDPELLLLSHSHKVLGWNDKYAFTVIAAVLKAVNSMRVGFAVLCLPNAALRANADVAFWANTVPCAMVY